MTQNPQFSENTSFEMDFDQSAINIGSHPDNDIVLKGAGVRPFHVSLVLQDGECQVLPLEAEAAVRLDGKPVETAQFKLAGAARRLDIGENTLLLEYNKTFDSLHVRINPGAPANASTASKLKDAAQAAPAISPGGESPILLNLFSQTDEVEVGQTATYELEIVNAGALVASFKVFVEGVPKEWVSIAPEEINLYEGQRKQVQINITPPRQPDSTAGQHELRVSAFSTNYQGYQAAVPIFLRIKPYYEFILGNLAPREQKVSWFKRLANTSLPITNRGNCPADFAVSAMDDENGCSFDFVLADELRLNRQAALPVAAGQILPLPIEISPHKRRWITGKRYSYTTTVQVTNQPVAPQMVSGSLSSQPLFPWWSIVLALLFLAVGIFIMLQPNIYSFQVAANKDVIELGDSTKLEWSVSPFANLVSISNTTQPLTSGQISLTVTPTQSTTYELVAGNWLSGLLHMDRRESRTVLVVPPSPTINAFSVDNTRVAEGKPTKIRWSVTQADQAFLTVGDVVIELPKEQFSGERDEVLAKDALVTLEAKNASGHDLRSYFVNVDAPKITITAFTVWVKTAPGKTGMPIKNGAGKRAALPQAPPDPNFSDKYVELVPDATSDTGYRVYFYQPDRELDKGEQVMVEWNVVGADNDKVQIAPFTDTLPAKGSQPFFPDASMNFVLTAKSGVLEKIFMLPVKVFNGSPPVAPKIEFFQAVPISLVGAGSVEFSWSVSGAWTRVQLANGKTTVGDYLTPQGFKSVTVSESGTYILTAWNGDLSSAKPLDIVVNPKLILPNLMITGIYPVARQFMVGDAITVSVKFTNKPDPTGSVTVTDGTSSCSITLPALSCILTFTSAGQKNLRASYSGDAIYQQKTSTEYPKKPDYILVSSPTVQLTSSFYLTPARSASIVVSDQQFSINQQLYVTITVKPVGAVFPADPGKVSLTICKQQKTKELPEPDTCKLTAAAVIVTSDSRSGTARIDIPNFPGAGTFILRFDYQQAGNLLAPASVFQPNVQVSKMGIYLTLPPASACKNSLPANADCTVGYSNAKKAQLLFYIHQTVGGDYLDSTLPRPDATPFRGFEVNPSQNFSDCQVGTITLIDVRKTRVVYTLMCSADLHGQSRVSVNYDFDNKQSVDYFMGSDPSGKFSRQSFNLLPIINTALDFKVTTYQVGQMIRLTSPPGNTSGVINLYVKDDPGKTLIRNVSGKISLTVTSSNATDGLLDVTDDSTCIVAGNGKSVANIDVDETCVIFFRKTDNWNLRIDFAGDVNFASSSADVSGLSVSKQGQISMAWNYEYYIEEEKGYKRGVWPSLLPIETNAESQTVQGQIIFTGPTGTGFSNKALQGVELKLTFDSGPFACTFTSVPTIRYENAQALVNFVVDCPIPSRMSVSVAFGAGATADFAMKPDVSASRIAVFTSKTKTTPSLKGTFIRVDDPLRPNLVVGVSGGTGTVKMLYAGEKYKISFQLNDVRADTFFLCNPTSGDTSCRPTRTVQDSVDLLLYENKSQNDHHGISVALPDNLKSRIATLSGTCSLDKDTKNIIIPFTQIHATWVDEFVRISPNNTVQFYKSEDYTKHPLDINKPNSSYDCPICLISAQLASSDSLGVDECTVTFNFSTTDPNTVLPIGANQPAVFSVSPAFSDSLTGMDYWINDPYTMRGLTKAFVTTTFQKFNTTVPTRQTVVMTLVNNDTTQYPILDNVLTNWFDVSYPACMTLSGNVDLYGQPKDQVTWTLAKPKTYPCIGTLEIAYKENTYFGRKVLVSQPVHFMKPLVATVTPTVAPK